MRSDSEASGAKRELGWIVMRGGDMKLKNDDKLDMVNRCLLVNGRPFVVDVPDEDLYGVEDNKLVTLFRGHLYNYWNPEDIEGYYA